MDFTHAASCLASFYNSLQQIKSGHYEAGHGPLHN